MPMTNRAADVQLSMNMLNTWRTPFFQTLCSPENANDVVYRLPENVFVRLCVFKR